MTRHLEAFQGAIKITDALVSPSDLEAPNNDVRLFHLLVGALEWCSEHKINFNLVLAEALDSFAEDRGAA